VLKPYLKSSGLDALIEKQQSAAGGMTALVPKSQTRFDPKRWKRCVAAFVELVAAERAIIELISDLQSRIVAALDETERYSADINADKKRKSSRLVPENDDVKRLADRINRDLRYGGSKRSIAIEFTGGDEALADRLLRQLRRFRHLLK
jgi:hypothetical protein